jgi:hypothetical protein
MGLVASNAPTAARGNQVWNSGVWMKEWPIALGSVGLRTSIVPSRWCRVTEPPCPQVGGVEDALEVATSVSMTAGPSGRTRASRIVAGPQAAGTAMPIFGAPPGAGRRGASGPSRRTRAGMSSNAPPGIVAAVP